MTRAAFAGGGGSTKHGQNFIKRGVTMRLTLDNIEKVAPKHTIKELGDIYKRNPESIRSYLIKHNIPYKHERQKMTKDQELDVVAYLCEHTVDETAEHFGFPRRVVSAISTSYGMKTKRGCSVTNDIERCLNCPFKDCIAGIGVILWQEREQEESKN